MCGDEFIETEYRDGYRRDGSLIVRRWKHCPRNGEYRPDYWDRWQVGRCIPVPFFACANEKRAYAEHRPYHGACAHNSVSEDGDACWAKDGTPITGPQMALA
jgi:ribosomal protein S27AE